MEIVTDIILVIGIVAVFAGMAIGIIWLFLDSNDDNR